MAEHRSERLMGAIENIFGSDIVADVWAIIPDVIGTIITQEVVDNCKPKIWENGLGVEYNFTEVVILFKNGNKVLFDASEYGAIQRA